MLLRCSVNVSCYRIPGWDVSPALRLLGLMWRWTAGSTLVTVPSMDTASPHWPGSHREAGTPHLTEELALNTYRRKAAQLSQRHLQVPSAPRHPRGRAQAGARTCSFSAEPFQQAWEGGVLPEGCRQRAPPTSNTAHVIVV